jgi:DNA (cytosine-5)-methyltransferase 1
MGGLSLGFLLGLKDARIDGFDIDADAVETYNLNLSGIGGSARRQDVLSWSPSGEYDIIIGGSPCQPFTIANTVNRGEKHPLFPTFSRFFDLLLEFRPMAFVFENVKGLLSRSFRPLLLAQLDRLKKEYRVEMGILNAADYGVPQRRLRLIVVGIRRDLNIVPTLPKPTHSEVGYLTLCNGELQEWVTVYEAIGDILSVPPNTRFLLTNHVMTEKGGRDNERSDWGSRVMQLDAPAYTITEKHRSGQLIPIPVTKYQMKHPPLSLDAPARSVTSHLSKASRDMLIPLETPALTILGDGRIRPLGHHINLSGNGEYRRLTVRECLRLQSFPDWFHFPEHVSISKRYKLVGEAVPPILAYRIATCLGRSLNYAIKEPNPEQWMLPYFQRVFT